MTNKHMKRCSTSLVISEMQIKTTRYKFQPTRMAITNKTDNNKYWKGEMGRDPFTLLVECKTMQLLWKFLKM